MFRAPIPRNFKLLEESNSSKIVSRDSVPNIYWEIDFKKDDIYLHYWTGAFYWAKDCLFEFHMFCSDEYPSEPPYVRFTRPRLEMRGVDHRGVVDWENMFEEAAFKWEDTMGIKNVLELLLTVMVKEGVDLEYSQICGSEYSNVDLKRISMAKTWIPLWPETHDKFPVDVREAVLETLCISNIYHVPKDVKKLLTLMVLKYF